MHIRLKYGEKGLDLDFPQTSQFVGVLYPQEAAVLPAPEEAVEQALRQPVESQSLREIAQGKADAVIVISDITRPVPNALLLPVIIRHLLAAGIPADKITILIATGIHRPNEGQELERLVGREIAKTYRIINHFSKNQEDMVLVGHIGDGVPALVNKHYLAADLKTLEFMPGPEMVAHPRTRYGILEGNPFHEAGLAIMEQAGADFIVNVTLDTSKKITGVFAGHPVKAHLEGVEFLSRHCIRTLDEPLDGVVTTNAGAPLDCNLYQTAKGISGVAGATREGGVILIATECLEGFGSEEYRAVFEHATTPQAFIEKLMKKEFFLPDQWCAQETYQVMLKQEIWVYTHGIDADTLQQYHFKPVRNMARAIAELLARYGPDARWAIVPDGPLLILNVAET